MITDRIQLAGRDSYFQDPATNPGKIDLGGLSTTIRTAPLNKGQQVEISGIQLLIEHDDLRPLLRFQFVNNNRPEPLFDPSPLFRIAVIKEMFPGLFADPFSHRVHNIAGYLDFNEGTLTNGRIIEVDGIPTIASIGKEECVWISKEYKVPNPISIDAIAWELATSKLTPPHSFHYKIKIASNTIDAAGNVTALPDIDISNGGQMLQADARRAVDEVNDVAILDGLNNRSINSFQITFTAKVFEDSFIKERHLPVINGNIGRPLLRAINILEPVQSIYVINSLVELQDLSSDFHLFERPQAAIRHLTATLDLRATLVNSPNQKIVNNIYDTRSQFEYVELELFANQFKRFEAKRSGFELRTNI